MQTNKTWVLTGLAIVAASAFSMPALAVPGDMNMDGDIDAGDYVLFRDCFLGPQSPTLPPGCENARFDADSDVDLHDFVGFQTTFTGPCPGALPNDRCQCPIEVADGTHPYRSVGANTDGPDEPTMCLFFGLSQVESDLWYCYTASCTGTALVSLCGSDYDTKLAVYAGCGCPSATPLACSDDDCGTDVEIVQSRVEVSVTAGQQYMIRAGGFGGDQGNGLLTIGCNVDACADATSDCFLPSPNGEPGCGEASCCATTCNLDTFCCDVTWDETCAGEAQGVCTGSFEACAPGAGLCGTPDLTPGCDSVNCCNRVCSSDPYCCLEEWDALCVDKAEAMCFLACNPTAGDCFSARVLNSGDRGCALESCCEAVCIDDDFCCITEWDQLCATTAATLCP